MFVVDFASIMVDRFSKYMIRYANLSDKVMERFSIIHNDSIASKEECLKLESTDKRLADKFTEIFYQYSGVEVPKPKLKRLFNTVKNNRILDGKNVDSQFL